MNARPIENLYEGFSVSLETRQGFSLCAAGICKSGKASLCCRNIKKLYNLKVEQHDLYAIDFILAQALKEVNDGAALLLGASLNTRDIFAPDERTGGVLGSPCDDISSSEGVCEMLPDGFSLYTLPGGPGLAAIGSEETVKDTLEKIKAAADKGFLQTEMIVKTLQEAGLNTALLVFDGTGAYANGYTGVLAAGKYQYASL